jgi:hypothetical protein
LVQIDSVESNKFSRGKGDGWCYAAFVLSNKLLEFLGSPQIGVAPTDGARVTEEPRYAAESVGKSCLVGQAARGEAAGVNRLG